MIELGMTRLVPGLIRATPDASGLIPYVRDNANPSLRDMRAMTLEQLAAALGGALGPGAGAFTTAEIAAYQEEAAAYSDAVTRRTVALSQPDAELVLWLAYGQSLSLGAQSWPPATRAQAAPDLFMMGSSVHSQTSNTVWAPLGGGGLNPLVSTVVYTNTPLTDEQIAALDPNAAPSGETPLEGFLAQLRPAWLASRGKPAGDPNNRWVAAACGIGSSSLASLSKGATPQEKFNRLRGAITSAKALATANGWSFKIGGMLFDQGQEDYQIDTSAAAWLALFTQFAADFREYAVSQTGQSGTIPIFLIQSGGISGRDAQELAVGRAQIAAASIPGVYVAASNAPVPDKGTHLTAHGSRMVGMQAGKAAARVLVGGEGYEATRAIRWVYRDRTLLGLFHPPVFPLRLTTAYDGRTPVPPRADAGIYVADDAGQNALTSPAIINRLIVAQLGRAPSGVCKVWLGRRTAPYNGIVSIADSDSTRLAAGYDYVAGSGQWESENIPALVGLSYPAASFALADVQTAVGV